MLRKLKTPALPVRRDLHFDLPAERILDWHANGAGVTAFINALSVTFPAGERFFIHSVRHFRDQITDPELKQAVTAFIGQEAMHGREHDEWNAHLFDRVPETRALENRLARRLDRWKRRLPKTTQLAITIGAEHITAVLGDLMLREREFLEGHKDSAHCSHPGYVALLRWHGLEETEHKAVAYDVWRSVMRSTPRAYLERSFGLVFILSAYWPDITDLIRASLKAQPECDPQQERKRIKSFLYGRTGIFRQLGLPVLRYFKPGFYPWDDDNRALLAELDGLSTTSMPAT